MWLLLAMLLIACVTHANYVIVIVIANSSNDFISHYKQCSPCAKYFNTSTFETVMLYRQSSKLVWFSYSGFSKFKFYHITSWALDKTQI